MGGQWAQNGTGYDIEERVQKVATLVWDTDCLMWVRSPLGSAGSGSAATGPTKALFDQANPNLLYIGKAAPGSADTDSVWRITRILFAASGLPESITYAAAGSATSRWDQRAGLSYS